MTRLFDPIRLRDVIARNRLVISPMCNYSAHDGMVNDWHLVTLGRYAQGGAGIVFVEASAVQEHGRITHGDLGIWHDGQIEGLKRIADFLRAQGAVPAIQLAHAGRKASMARPWFGNGPLTQADLDRGDQPWPIQAPCDLPIADGWLKPAAMSVADIGRLQDDFVAAAGRALRAGYDIIEMHCAHGYLLHSFLSPLSNLRADHYGGGFEGRSRIVLEIAQRLRAAWPADKPLFVRLSSVDDLDGGWELSDSIRLSRLLKERGVDVIDCSSGGITGSATGATAVVPRTPRVPLFQVPYARAIKHEVGIATMAVGLILTPQQAAAIADQEEADLVAIGREALADPNWPVHAAQSLGADAEYRMWPKQFGWWLNVRQGVLRKLGLSTF